MMLRVMMTAGIVPPHILRLGVARCCWNYFGFGFVDCLDRDDDTPLQDRHRSVCTSSIWDKRTDVVPIRIYVRRSTYACSDQRRRRYHHHNCHHHHFLSRLSTFSVPPRPNVVVDVNFRMTDGNFLFVPELAGLSCSLRQRIVPVMTIGPVRFESTAASNYAAAQTTGMVVLKIHSLLSLRNILIWLYIRQHTTTLSSQALSST